MLYILSHPRLTKSAKPLAKRISEIVGENILVYKEPENHLATMVIRYGNSGGGNFIKDTDYNSPQSIRLAGNKARLSELCVEKDFPHLQLFRNKTPEKFPVVVRTELNAGGGIGLYFCETLQEWQQKYKNYSWCYYYPFQFELGVHILGGEIKRVFKKVREDGLPEEKYPRRNTNNGYSFSLRENWKEHYSGIEKFVKKLYEIVPIQFARLDVGYNKETGGWRLIEINSAPDLSQNKNTLELYAQFLAERIVK